MREGCAATRRGTSSSPTAPKGACTTPRPSTPRRASATAQASRQRHPQGLRPPRAPEPAQETLSRIADAPRSEKRSRTPSSPPPPPPSDPAAEELWEPRPRARRGRDRRLFPPGVVRGCHRGGPRLQLSDDLGAHTSSPRSTSRHASRRRSKTRYVRSSRRTRPCASSSVPVDRTGEDGNQHNTRRFTLCGILSLALVLISHVIPLDPVSIIGNNATRSKGHLP